MKGQDATNSYVELKFLNANKSQVLGAASAPVQSGTFGWQYQTATLSDKASVPSGTTWIMPEFLAAPTTSNTKSDAKS
ncbi:hypothetical protein [Alicyclobacillus sp. ALC3]|uniref:hypothetical protein n=1 Tax=Alicyclobacillus sp. ALC3 TaxID=2796143 RepID=UPI002379C983|nr:hypothetical protein [Alicyclobacillus sp. ALC3]WDL95506.1 hypothetical protein JC200_14015 [Alicyclobacillus sp. ALC3]